VCCAVLYTTVLPSCIYFSVNSCYSVLGLAWRFSYIVYVCVFNLSPFGHPKTLYFSILLFSLLCALSHRRVEPWLHFMEWLGLKALIEASLFVRLRFTFCVYCVLCVSSHIWLSSDLPGKTCLWSDLSFELKVKADTFAFILVVVVVTDLTDSWPDYFSFAHRFCFSF